MWVCTMSSPPPPHPPLHLTQSEPHIIPPPSFFHPDPESPPEYGQCFRVVTNARGCELPLLGNLTQEVCCCTVGRAWGRNCERCPLQGTGEWSEVSWTGATTCRETTSPDGSVMLIQTGCISFIIKVISIG